MYMILKKKISLLFCLEMFYSVYFQILKFTNLNLMLKRSEKVRLEINAYLVLPLCMIFLFFFLAFLGQLRKSCDL